MPDGVIVGGWGYVISAYSFAAAALLLYAVSLVLRHRAASAKLAQMSAEKIDPEDHRDD